MSPNNLYDFHHSYVYYNQLTGSLIYKANDQKPGTMMLFPDNTPSNKTITQLYSHQDNQGNEYIVLGTSKGEVFYYDGSSAAANKWTTLHDAGWDSAITQMSVNWLSDGKPQVALALHDTAVEYYSGGEKGKWSQLADTQTMHSYFVKMKVYFPTSPNTMPKIIGYTANKDIVYYDGTDFSYLPNKQSTDQLASLIDSDGNARIIAGNDDGQIVYSYHEFQGAAWETKILHGSGWGTGVAQMSVDWTNPSKPRIVVSLKDGAVEYYDGENWKELHNNKYPDNPKYLSVYWPADSSLFPKIIMKLGDNQIASYVSDNPTVPTDGWKTHFMNTKFSSTYFHDSQGDYSQESYIGSDLPDNLPCSDKSCSYMAVNFGMNNSNDNDTSQVNLKWYTRANIPKSWTIFSVDPFGNYRKIKVPYIGMYDSNNGAYLTIPKETNTEK
jgi:hypothetical protein